MKKIRALFIQNYKETPFQKLIIYTVIYFSWGLAMNWIGQLLEIAKFVNWWQIITCYILYMIPISILLKNFTFFNQYCYGLLAMGILEFGGYSLGTSYIYPNNILDELFGTHVFALAMTLFFALYFPVGNLTVNRIYLLLVEKTYKNT